MTEQEKVIDRVRKLMALGESSNQHESELAILRANELMEKHQLSMSDVEVRDIDKSQIIKEDYTVDGQKMKLHWIENLAFGVAKLFDGTVLVNSRLHGTHFTFVGFPDDVAMMKVLFDNLYKAWNVMIPHELLAAKSTFAADHGEWTTWAPKDTMKFKQGHGVAYASTIYHRCVEAARLRKDNVADASCTGTALVLAKDVALRDFGKQEGWGSTKRTTSRGSRMGNMAGRAAGQAAQITPPLK